MESASSCSAVHSILLWSKLNPVQVILRYGYERGMQDLPKMKIFWG